MNRTHANPPIGEPFSLDNSTQYLVGNQNKLAILFNNPISQSVLKVVKWMSKAIPGT